MARTYGTNIFPAVERRAQQRYALLTPAQQRRLTDPVKSGQFSMWAMADEVASIYARTGQRGATIQRVPIARSLYYVTHGDVAPALADEMAPMLLEDGLQLRSTLEFMLLSYLPDKEAAVIIVAGSHILCSIFTITDQTVRTPAPPRKLLPDAGMYRGLGEALPRDVRQASADHPDGKRYWFFSDSLGTLGRVVVRPQLDGTSQIVSEFADGDPDPARNAQRAAIFQVVSDNMFLPFGEKTQP